MELELLRLDLSTHYAPIHIDPEEEEWKEVRRKYWVKTTTTTTTLDTSHAHRCIFPSMQVLDTYNIPTVKHADILDLTAEVQPSCPLSNLHVPPSTYNTYMTQEQNEPDNKKRKIEA